MGINSFIHSFNFCFKLDVANELAEIDLEKFLSLMFS